jgi:hypothetical protein
MLNNDPHPWVEGRKSEGPPTVKQAAKELHGKNWFSKFNAKIGLKITFAVGTMWAAYLFALLALISAPSAFCTGDPIIIVAWIAQTFLQLVLLPIIIVGQNIQAKAADMRAQSTFDDAEAVLHEARQIQKHLEEQDNHLQTIIKKLERF